MDKQDNRPLPPGDAIREALKVRGWTQEDLARILGRTLAEVNKIIMGKQTITANTAISLGAAFGDDAQKWLDLESRYRLWLAMENKDSSEVVRRAYLYDVAPVKEMENRVWIRSAQTMAELETSLCRFFNTQSLDEIPAITGAPRKSSSAGPLTPAQRAWCFRALNIARTLKCPPFNPSELDYTANKLRELAAYPEEVGHISEVLGCAGIRFLVVEPLQGTKIDGVSLWLDDQSPVIVLSLRFDRIDWLWFTLMHEFSHIRHGDSSIDHELFTPAGQTLSAAKDAEAERRADEEAESILVPQDKLHSFILRVGPLYAKSRIVQFAYRVRIHPGIVVGQLQHRGEIGYGAHKEMLSKVRDRIISCSITDGWGGKISLG